MDEQQREITLYRYKTIDTHNLGIQISMRMLDTHNINGTITPKIYKNHIKHIHNSRRQIQGYQSDLGILPINTQMIRMYPRFKNGIYVS